MAQDDRDLYDNIDWQDERFASRRFKRKQKEILKKNRELEHEEEEYEGRAKRRNYR